MSRQKKRKRAKSSASLWESPRLAGLLQIALGLWLLLSLTGDSPGWWDVLQDRRAVDLFSAGNPGGPVGGLAAFALRLLFGMIWAWAVSAWLVVRGVALLARGAAPILPWPDRVLPLAAASAVWFAQPLTYWFSTGESAMLGGAPAFYLARGVHALVGGGCIIFLSFFLLTALVLIFRPWLGPVVTALGAAFEQLVRGLGLMGRGVVYLLALPWKLVKGTAGVWRGLGGDMARQKPKGTKKTKAKTASGEQQGASAAAADDDAAEPTVPRRVHRPVIEDDDTGPIAAAGHEGEPHEQVTRKTRGGGSVSTAVRKGDGPEVFAEADGDLLRDPALKIPLPSVDLLREPVVDDDQVSEDVLNASADLLEETLRSFGVDGAVRDVRPGPVVTTFEYQPASGVKVNAIVQRTDDLALAMKARSIRMEAPIPGKAAVGIEIPNPEAKIVSMKEVFTLAEEDMKTPLSVILGRDVFGDAVAIDLAAQPHLLVAGSTGSGKSVCVNAMICSMLLRCDPSLVRLLLIDPKMLELNVYNDIPHLLLPVVTDPKEALRALKWMEAQMDHRYRRLAKHSVRNIEGYNRKVEAGQVLDNDGDPIREPMPYYVCVVDELADLMMQLGQEIELPITRIAQKARAVGIHLVLATQRPSVDVLTGVIKANIPCRIAFRVIQKNDSRTILDTNGADKLLGRGDMLYLQPGRALPVRVHGAFVDIDEAEAIADHWKQYKDTTRPITLDEEREESLVTDVESDPLFEKAREIVVYSQHGSTSMLQRKLQVGYSRAGRLMDLLEVNGVVGPFIGSKARDVLLQPDDLQVLEASEGGDDLP